MHISCFDGCLCVPLAIISVWRSIKSKERRYRSISERLRNSPDSADIAAAIDDATIIANHVPPCQSLPRCLLCNGLVQAREQLLRDIPNARLRLQALLLDSIYDLKEDLSKAIRDKQEDALQAEIRKADEFITRMQQLPLGQEARLRLAFPQLEHVGEIRHQAFVTNQAVGIASSLSIIAESDAASAEVARVAQAAARLVHTSAHSESQLAECTICLTEKRQRGGAHCHPSAQHFLCERCLCEYARREAGLVDGAGARDPHGKVRCPDHNCQSLFPLEVIACRCSPDVLHGIVNCHVQAALAVQEDRIRAQETARANREILRLQQMDPEELLVEVAVRHIREDIFMLKCPRCGVAFHDFDGCCALTCANNQCSCSFCAWCLQDCGRDAHDHVRKCPSKHAAAESFWGTMEQFRAVQRDRQERNARAYLATLGPNTRDVARRRLEPDALDLGIHLEV